MRHVLIYFSSGNAEASVAPHRLPAMGRFTPRCFVGLHLLAQFERDHCNKKESVMPPPAGMVINDLTHRLWHKDTTVQARVA